MNIYNVNSYYIKALRKKYGTVMMPKDDISHNGGRKYLGIAFEFKGFNYFIPVSSGNDNDYEINPENGKKIVKSDSLFSSYLKHLDKTTGDEKIDSVLKFGNMIPIPSSELRNYTINLEKNEYYKRKFQKLYKYIQTNQSIIEKKAKRIRALDSTKTPINYKMMEKTVSEYTFNRVLYLEFKGKELINNEFYNMNDKKRLYRIIGQATNDTKIIASLPKKDLENNDYSSLNLYRIKDNKFDLIANLFDDVQEDGIVNINKIIDRKLEEIKLNTKQNEKVEATKNKVMVMD